jgi:hypothetical protein
MKLFRSARWLLLALLLSLVPASAFAGVFISVGFAPPVLPVYVQPECPQPGLMWTPGYWAYGPDGYYWVPGAWVPAPYEGALWTPGYWGWSGGLYVFHDGYWGPHVGYYGGVNYGFGYMGIGFVGGVWRGHEFAYNTAVVHVNESFVHTTYVDRTVVERNTIVNDRHVAYSGGLGGINHPPSPAERSAEHEQHVQPTHFQQQHLQTAQSDRNSYVKNNGGHPQNLAVSHPLQAESHPAPNSMRSNERAIGSQSSGSGAGKISRSESAPQQRSQTRAETRPSPGPASHAVPQSRPEARTQSRPAPQEHSAPKEHAAPKAEPQGHEHK